MDVLHLATEHVDGATVVISVRGELDVSTTPHLKAAVAELVSRGDNRLVLDLAGLSFIDSTGIGALIGSQHRVREASGSLVLRAVPARVRSVLAVVGLEEAFVIEDPTIDLATDDLAVH